MEEINLPPRGKSTGRKPLYNYMNLEIGDSMPVPKKNKQSVINAARNYGRKHNIKFAARTDNEGNTTLWRIS